MQNIVTNIRFDKDKYFEIKKISQSNRESYKENYLKSKAKRKKLFEFIVNSSVNIDIPVVDIVHEGRKFE